VPVTNKHRKKSIALKAIGKRFGMLLRRVKNVFMPYDLVGWLNIARIFDLRTFNLFFLKKTQGKLP
jgi:hypothetical protein